MANETTIESNNPAGQTSTLGLLFWTIIALVVDTVQIIIFAAAAGIPVIGWIFSYFVSVILAVIFYVIFYFWLKNKGASHWLILGLGLFLEVIPVVNLFFWIGLSVAIVLAIELAKEAAGIAAQAAQGKVKAALKTAVKKGVKLAAEALAPELAPAIETVSKVASVASAAKSGAQTISRNKPQF